jgi:predicted transposase YbfD/YdcC
MNNLDITQLEIQANPELANLLTCKYNYCSIITVYSLNFAMFLIEWYSSAWVWRHRP